MAQHTLEIFFNFRSPYCYLASVSMFDVFDRFDIAIEWRPLGSWDGRSPPDRAAKKMPLARQDVARWCRRLQIPFKPPPATTDPTNAGIVSIEAEKQGLLAPYVVGVMAREWAHGQDIGDIEILFDVGAEIGLDKETIHHAIDSPDHHKRLAENWQRADTIGVFGVPSFVVGEEIFWGNDRLDFLAEHLANLRLEKR